jgi:hypothetical protein
MLLNLKRKQAEVKIAEKTECLFHRYLDCIRIYSSTAHQLQ